MGQGRRVKRIGRMVLFSCAVYECLSAGEEACFAVAVTATRAVIAPRGVADDLTRERAIVGTVRGDGGRQGGSTPGHS